MDELRQILAVRAMSLSALPPRIGAALVTVIGVACVVGVMLSLLGVGAGVMHSVCMHQAGRPGGRALLWRVGRLHGVVFAR